MTADREEDEQVEPHSGYFFAKEVGLPEKAAR
jgi:hypothetical protein